MDLREAARHLNTHNWERNLALLDNAAECDKALFVPSQKPLSMFDPTTWSKCFSEWWFGDGLPNDSQRPRKITFEKLFACLMHREDRVGRKGGRERRGYEIYCMQLVSAPPRGPFLDTWPPPAPGGAGTTSCTC